MRIICLWLLLAVIQFPVFAQKEQAHWYMGVRYGMKFENGQRQVLPPHPDNSLETFSLYNANNACISHPKTGEFLFQANGPRVLDKNFKPMPGGKTGANALHTMIVPNKADTFKYFIIYAGGSSVYYAEVDMRLRGGLGDVTTYDKLIRTNALDYFTVVQGESDNRYWIVTHTMWNNEYRAYYIDGDKINLTPVSSFTGNNIFISPSTVAQTNTNMVGNKSGTVIAHAYSAPLGQIDILSFNKCTGKIVQQKTLSARVSQTSIPFFAWAAFSAGDKYLYASVQSARHEILRYNLKDADPNATCTLIASVPAGSTVVPKPVALAPDGDMYVVTIDTPDAGALINSWRIGIISQAESASPVFTYNAFPFFPNDISTYYPTFPPFVMDTTKVIRGNFVEFGCIDDSVKFYAHSYNDSTYWDMGDGNRVNGIKSSYLYKNPGKYTVELHSWMCDAPFASKFEIVVAPRVMVDLGPDTLLCHGVKYPLEAEKNLTRYEWSTGEKTDGITVDKPGTYRAFVTNGICKDYDTVNIEYNPQIWVELGNEFYLCEEDSQAVKLDAGKGFEEYLWTPTEDTTQWIVVKKAGPYFVIVEDFRGCPGEDGTVVERRCNLYAEIPNAFTPNGDGLNDVFAPFVHEAVKYELAIYNRWGEQVFFSDTPSLGWSGTYNETMAPEGVYFYTVYYSGYQNGLLRRHNKAGNVSLMR